MSDGSKIAEVTPEMLDAARGVLRAKDIYLATDELKAMLAAALAVTPKHKIEVDGPPCPTCGHAIRRRQREPFVLGEDD